MEQLTHHELCTNEPEWNESYYFVFYDKKNNLGGMTRLGFKPNKQEGMTFFFLFLPDGSASPFQNPNVLETVSAPPRNRYPPPNLFWPRKPPSPRCQPGCPDR